MTYPGCWHGRHSVPDVPVVSSNTYFMFMAVAGILYFVSVAFSQTIVVSLVSNVNLTL